MRDSGNDLPRPQGCYEASEFPVIAVQGVWYLQQRIECSIRPWDFACRPLQT